MIAPPAVRWFATALVAAALLVPLLADPAAAQVRLNEVLADPAGSDHHEEFVELRNAGPDTVDLAGWRLGNADESDAIVDAGWGTRVGPGELAVVLDASYFGSSTVYDSVRAWARIVTIEDRAFGRTGWSNSAAEQVVLRDGRGATVDSMTYDPGDGVPGHSWERRRPTPGGWSLSYLAGGTPGRDNSVDQVAAPAGRVRIEAAPDPFRDRLEIRCRLPAAPALLSVAVYDAEGVRVARLADWTAAALESRWLWDGRDDTGRQVAPGLYVIHAQASAGGRVASGKRAVARH